MTSMPVHPAKHLKSTLLLPTLTERLGSSSSWAGQWHIAPPGRQAPPSLRTSSAAAVSRDKSWEGIGTTLFRLLRSAKGKQHSPPPPCHRMTEHNNRTEMDDIICSLYFGGTSYNNIMPPPNDLAPALIRS
jgi:hypothetical protein